jgi:hypothetical protein
MKYIFYQAGRKIGTSKLKTNCTKYIPYLARLLIFTVKGTGGVDQNVVLVMVDLHIIIHLSILPHFYDFSN